MNVKKVFDYLKSLEKFNSRHLWDENLITNGDSKTIWELLNDLWHFYTKRIKIEKKQKTKSQTNAINIQQNRTTAKKNKIPSNIPKPTMYPKENPPKPYLNDEDDNLRYTNIEKDIKEITKNEDNKHSHNNKFVENIIKVKDSSGYADTKRYQQVLTENISQILNTSHKNTNHNKSTLSHLKNLNIDTSRIQRNKKK